jgi:hypothetical protein
MKLLYHHVFQYRHKPTTKVDVLPNVVECSSYILPVITNGIITLVATELEHYMLVIL